MKRRERERGWGPWRKRWVSICGTHPSYVESCFGCAEGTWINVWRMSLHRALYRVSPALWERIVNRKES